MRWAIIRRNQCKAMGRKLRFISAKANIFLIFGRFERPKPAFRLLFPAAWGLCISCLRGLAKPKN